MSEAPAHLPDAPKPVEDIPLDQIIELGKSFEEVAIRLCRRNERGQVATVYNGLRMRVEDLQKIDDWAREMSGGGRYRCEVKDPLQQTRYVMSPFWFNVEGPPKPPRFLGSPEAMQPVGLQQQGAPAMNGYNGGGGQPPAPPQYSNQPQQPGQYAPPPSAWARGLDPSQQGGYMPQPYYAARPGGAFLPPGATTASDEIAMAQSRELKAELQQLRNESRAMQDKLLAENARMRAENEQAERRILEEKHNAQLGALAAKIEAMSARPVEPKVSMMEYAPVIAALAPILVAFLQSSKEGATKGLELQSKGLDSLMQATIAQGSKTSDTEKLLTTLGPLVMPLIGDMMKARSPETQAGLFQAMAENNLNSVAMMAQLIEAFATAGGKEEPWYLPMIKEALGGVVNVAQAYTQGQGLPGQQAIAPTPRGALTPVGTSGYTTLDESKAATPATAARPAQPVKPGLEMLFALLPGEYQTQEWRSILRGLHAEPQPAPAEQIAGMLASHLEHLVTFDMLPPGLTTLREHPRKTLETLVERLPVARTHSKYTVEVLDLTMQFLGEDGFLGQPAKADAPESEESGEPEGDEPEGEADAGEANAEPEPDVAAAG